VNGIKQKARLLRYTQNIELLLLSALSTGLTGYYIYSTLLKTFCEHMLRDEGERNLRFRT